MRTNPLRNTSARIVATAVLFAAACGAAQAVIVGSCNNPAGGMCVEYTGTAYNDAQSLQKICVSQKAAFIAGAGCPTEGRVGACVRSKGEALESISRYYTQFPGAGLTYSRDKVAAEGRRQCKPPKGEWMPNN